MSRIGKLPITVPAGVKVDIQPGAICVEGPKGKLCQDYTSNVKLELNDGVLTVVRADESKASNAAQGLYRNLLNNMVVGVTTGFSKSLVITGVGFRAEVEGQNKVIVSGVDKQAVGEFCAQIRKLRKPEPYKGKGIRYETETIRRKVGKSGVK